MKKLNLAVIGQGRSGRDIHGRFFKSEKNTTCTVKYVVELDPERRARAEEEYPGCKALCDYRELFDIEGIDLVVNASFSDMHYPITKDLLQHGFNVVVEKPFARNYYECSDLINTAEKNGVMLAVFQQAFLTSYYTHSYEIAKSGILGDIMQVSVKFSGFSRRWDWQTIQERLGGSLYNTGPHPIGIGLGFLDFADDATVVFSRLGRALTSGDAEDYAKIILAAKGKPVVDIEVSSIDAYCPETIKIQGTRGTYTSTTSGYKLKYIIDAENEERPLIKEPLRSEEGYPMYCTEKLITHEEENKYSPSSAIDAVKDYYDMVYARLTEGKPLALDVRDMAKIVSVMETVHAQNPIPKTVTL